jgi:glycosyltransferase involved in cell wall biosynthesis
MIGIREESKPKVLIFLNRLVIGGPAIDVISMAGFLQHDFEILVIYGEKEDHEVEANYLLSQYPNLAIKKLKKLKKSYNPFLHLTIFWTVIKIINSFKPSVVHTHGALPGVIGRLAAFYSRTPVIVHTFHGHFFHSYFNRFFSSGIIFIEKILTPISSAIIATSNRQMTDLVYKYKVAPKEKVTVIDLGIDEAFLSVKAFTKEESFSVKYKIEKGTVAIGIIARIVRVKNFNLFVEIVEKVLKTTSKKVVFFVIGDGYLKKEVQKQLSDKSISWSSSEHPVDNASVIFTSWITDIGEALSVLDIVLLTSNNEGTGLSLAESQYCGKPVVATNVGGVPDTVIDGETGFLVSPTDANTFANKLLLLIENEALRQQMGIAAKTFARDKFSKQKEIESLKQLYLKQLGVIS